MDGSVLFFLVGAAASTTLIALVIWPMNVVVHQLVRPSRVVWFAIISGLSALVILGGLGAIIVSTYENYLYGSRFSLLAGPSVSQFVLGLFTRPIPRLQYLRNQLPIENRAIVLSGKSRL
jgi:hypothetical protein